MLTSSWSKCKQIIHMQKKIVKQMILLSILTYFEDFLQPQY